MVTEAIFAQAELLQNKFKQGMTSALVVQNGTTILTVVNGHSPLIT